MIHQRLDIAHWIAEFPLDRLRAQAQQDATAVYDQDSVGPLEMAIQNEAFLWWCKNNRVNPYIEFNQAIENVIADREVNPTKWDALHLGRLAHQTGPKSETIISPIDAAVVEQLRIEMVAGMQVGRPVPTDVFIWSKGESPIREVTKIGGLPYWPKGRAWPLMKNKRPMQFVAQFCFADSLDLVGPLPGDVLAIFANPDFYEGLSWNDRRSALTFEWLSLGITDLVSFVDLPNIDSDWIIDPYFGSIHRMYDFPELGEIGGDFGWEHPSWSGLGLTTATKIGGVPWWEQGDPKLPGQFLCTLESIQPAFDVPYPYLNVPEQLSPTDGNHDLMWGDLGRLYLHFDGKRIYWEEQGG